jgi:hypothetical protein
MTELTKEQAVSVLIQAAKIAQSKGAFTLDDAAVVAQAIRTLAPQPEPQMEVVDAPDESPITE